MSLLIVGATIIDAVADRPVEDGAIWIEGQRIRGIGRRSQLGAPPGIRTVDATGKYAIPGLMNANVHLYGPTNLEGIARYAGRFEDVIAESAQVALRSGLTTVFDTWGPRRFLMNVRDRIAAGAIQLFVGPACSCLSVQTKVRCSVRATSFG